MKKFLTSLRPAWEKIDTCPAWTYYNALERNDARYLIRGIDYEAIPDVLLSHRASLNACLEDLTMQAAQYEIDTIKRNQIIFDLTKKVELLRAEHFHVEALLNYILVAGHNKAMEEGLAALGFGVRSDQSIAENVKRLRARNQTRMIKINEKEEELKALMRGDGRISAEKDKPEPIEKTLVAVEKHFGRDIDLTKVSVKKWLTMKNQVLEDIKRQKKWQTRKR